MTNCLNCNNKTKKADLFKLNDGSGYWCYGCVMMDTVEECSTKKIAKTELHIYSIVYRHSMSEKEIV